MSRLPQYLRLEIGAPARLQILREMSRRGWREKRATGFDHAAGYFCLPSVGTQPDGTRILYTHAGPAFRDERWAHDCEGGPDHRGWYTHETGEVYLDGSGLARGIVGRLTRGRFIAGYWWGDNGERVYFPESFDSERDAARAADSHAERWADIAREDSARFHALQDAEGAEIEALKAVRFLLPCRHISAAHHAKAREALQALREARELLAQRQEEYGRA